VRRELRQARRQFIVSTLRSGDLGLWMRRAAGGMAVSDVSNQSAMAKAGLKEGDHIISVNGHNVATEREFIDQLFASQDPKQTVPIVVNRAGKQETIHLLPSVLQEEYQAAEPDHLSDIGIIVDQKQPGELVVQSVVPKSPAFYAGVRSGDKVIRFDGQRIAALTDFIRTLANTQPGTASLEVNRNNQPRHLDIEVPEAGGGARTALRPTIPNTSGQPNAQGTQPGASPADQRPRLTPPTTQPRQ
jgi:S1-C subfamily serine protease